MQNQPAARRGEAASPLRFILLMAASAAARSASRSIRIVLINSGSAVARITAQIVSDTGMPSANPIAPTIGPPRICPSASIWLDIEMTVARTLDSAC